MEKKAAGLQEKLQAKLDSLNDENHAEYCRRDYNGNTGDYRPATHDGADYLYLSDWYGIAMQTYPVSELSCDQCADLLAGRNAKRW